MTKALDDIELHIAMALVQIPARVKKSFGSGNWKNEEDAILVISKMIGEHIRTHDESVEAREISRRAHSLKLMISSGAL